MAQLLAGREVRDVSIQVSRKDGEIRDAMMSAELIDVRGEQCLLTVIVDVTEHRSMERLLHNAESIGHVGSWSVDLRRGGARWSNEACRIVGYPEAPRGFDDFVERIDPEDRARVKADLALAMREGTGFEHEYRVVRPDGERRWVSVRAVVERDAGGAPARLAGAMQDVTERHEAEARLAASEQRYRSIVETTSQGIVTIGVDTMVSFVNGRAAALLGTTPAAMIGRQFRGFIDPVNRSEIEQRRARRIAGHTDTYDQILVRADGKRVLAEITAAPLVDAAATYVGSLLMITDVTQRRQHEEARSRLAAIVDSSRDAIASWSVDGTIQTWNAGAERMLGCPAAEAIGANIVSFIPDDRLGLHRETMSTLLRGDVVAVETQRRRKDGTFVEVALTRSPVVNERGEVIAVSSITRDITAQKGLEASLRETEHQLRQAQKMEAIGQLAGGIAHDFNNLLTVVLSSTTLIEEVLDPADPMAEDARAIREAAERAASLTSQLLAFSRRQVLQPRAVNLETIIAGMEKMLRRLLGERIELVIGTGHPANVLIDPGQFEQVILNLAVNARDAMPEGGELLIETEPAVRPEGDFVKVRVTDTGIGMDEATRQRMFEPFFTTKDVGKGTGLGLSTVFGIVRQSGGFVEVASVPGRGTTIDIFVPCTDRAERVIGAAEAPLFSMSGQGKTILFVEDEEPVRKLVQRMLRRQGYQVIAAANAGEALLIIEQKPTIDLLLTDVMMPIMNGRQLAERVRAIYPKLPVVYMSGYHDDDELRGMLVNDVAYLQKPVPRDVLVRRIRDMLDRR